MVSPGKDGRLKGLTSGIDKTHLLIRFGVTMRHGINKNYWRTLGLVSITIIGTAGLMGQWFLAFGGVVGTTVIGIYLLYTKRT